MSKHSLILFGDVNPSGHLPTTLGVRREDYPDYPNFGGDGGTVRYEEGSSRSKACPKRAFASSAGGEHAAARAFDNNIKTRWQAASKDGEWLAVDLGTPQRIGRVFFNWETAGANAYRIEVSDDGENWRSVYATDKSEGGEETVTFAPVTARYVRMFGVQRSTDFGFSLFDFEVRAPRN